MSCHNRKNHRRSDKEETCSSAQAVEEEPNLLATVRRSAVTLPCPSRRGRQAIETDILPYIQHK